MRAATLLLWALPSAALASPPGQLHRQVLDNGLVVLVLEDRSAPLVSVGMMYTAGARNEAAGITGLAHFVEHMAFRDTARFPGSESTEAITRIGGRWSGYTWIDQTYYAATVPREALGLVLDIERDRMTGAVFAPEEFARERRSVVAELHSYDDPASVLYDAVLAASFELHPYRHNTIGWLTDVEQIGRDEAWRFYRRFYHPHNAVLAVVGDVEAPHLLAEVRRRFAELPAAGESTAVRTVEPPQSGQRRVVVRRPGPHAQLLLAFRAPALTEADFPAMVLLDALLAGGKGFRFTREYPAPPEAPLQRALVAEGPASRAASDWQPSRYPYVYTLSASLPGAGELARAEAEVWRLLARAAEAEWTDEELRLARRQVRAAWAGDLDDLAGRAHQLAFFEVSGDGTLLWRIPELLERVGREELRRFARERLRPERATVGWFVPVEAEAGPAAAAVPATPTAPAPVPPAAPLAPPSARAAEPPASLRLAHGIALELVPAAGAGLVALRAGIDLGPPAAASRHALAALLAERLVRPAPGEPAAGAVFTLTPHEEPEAFGAFRWIELSTSAMAEDAPLLLRTLAARLSHAAAPLSDEEWRTLVDAAAGRAREHDETAATAAWARALAGLYPPASPLAAPAWSSEAALAAASPEALRALAREALQPTRLAVSVAGLPATEARALVEATLGRWRPAAPLRPRPSPVAAPRGPARWTEVRVPWPGKAQDDLLVVWPGLRAGPADHAATEALLYLLGETGYAGRLGRALVGPGLVYHVAATLEEAPGLPGFLAVRTAAAPADTRQALDRIRQVVEEAARGGFTQAELDEAKAYLRGRDALRREGALDAAASALHDRLQPRPFVPQSLTLAQLNAAARRLLARGAPLAIVVGPEAVAERR